MSGATPQSLKRRQSRLLAEVHKLAETPNFAHLAEAEAAAAEFEQELEKLQSEISSNESFDPMSSPDQQAAAPSVVSEEEFPIGQETSDQPPQPSPPPAPVPAPRFSPPPSPLLLDTSPGVAIPAELRPSFTLSMAREETLEISSPTKRAATAQTAQRFPIDKEVGTEKRPPDLTVRRMTMEISRSAEIPHPDKKALLRSLNEDRRKKFWSSMENFHVAAESIVVTGERMGKMKFEQLDIYRPRKDFLFVPRRPKKPKISLLQISSVVLIQRAFREYVQRLHNRKLLGAFSALPDARSRARTRSRKNEISS